MATGFVQDVVTRIVNVHWEEKKVAPTLFLGWRATMIDPSGGGAPPLWEPNTETVMQVNVEDLPSPGRTTLVIHPGIDPSSTSEDEVRGTFPDGEVGKPDSGTITSYYFLSNPFAASFDNGTVQYATTATRNPFNGASVVSIAITVHLRPIRTRDHGYEWFAIAGAGGIAVPPKRIEGIAGSGGTLSFKATLDLKADPPTLDLS